MTEPTIEEVERACCEYAGIGSKSFWSDCGLMGYDCQKFIDEGIKTPTTPDLERICSKCYMAQYHYHHPTGPALAEKLKAWLVEHNVLFWHTNWCADCKPEVAYRAEILPRNLSTECDDDVPHAEAPTEHEAFIRAFYAAFCKEAGDE